MTETTPGGGGGGSAGPGGLIGAIGSAVGPTATNPGNATPGRSHVLDEEELFDGDPKAQPTATTEDTPRATPPGS
jgi:hypothetical protein